MQNTINSEPTTNKSRKSAKKGASETADKPVNDTSEDGAIVEQIIPNFYESKVSENTAEWIIVHFAMILVRLSAHIIAKCNGYAGKLSRGEQFADSEISDVRALLAEMKALSILYKAKAAETLGEDNAAFGPLQVWAESLCNNPDSLVSLTGENGYTGSIRAGGILRDSMKAALGELTAGRAGKKAHLFGAKNANAAHVSAVTGEGEEMSVSGTLSLIGKDNNGSMQTLIERMHAAVDTLTDIEANIPKAETLLYSQAAFTRIAPTTFATIAQAAIYGRLSNKARTFAASLERIAKDAPRVPTGN